MQDLDFVRILIMHDSLTEADAIADVLRKQGIPLEYEHFSRHAQLLELLQQKKFDLILASAECEGLNIELLLKALQQQRCNIPVIGIAQQYYRDVALTYLNMGLSDFVAGDETKQLLHSVQNALLKGHIERQYRSLKNQFQAGLSSFDLLLESMQEPVAFLHQGAFVKVNDAFAQLLRYSHKEHLLGETFLDIISENDRDEMKKILADYDHHRLTSVTDISLETRSYNGHAQHIEGSLTPTIIDGEPCEQLLIKSKTAAATPAQRLLSSQHFLQEAGYRIQHADGKRHALLVLELDHMHNLREQRGIAASDQVIKQVCQLLQDSLAENIQLSKFANHIFVMLTEHDNADELKLFCDHLRDNISHKIFPLDDYQVNLTCSIGCANSDSSDNIEELLSLADTACKLAQKAGGNQVHFYNAETDQAELDEADQLWLERLRAALQNQQFRLLFQPIVSLHAAPQHKYEVFLRLCSDSGEEIPPSAFMHTARRTGLTADMDRWVIEQSLLTLQAQMEKQDTPHSFFIKLSRASLQSTDFLSWLKRLLANTPLPEHSIVFEIDENMVVEIPHEVRALIAGLRDLGCQTAIEHFGTHEDAFNLIKSMDVDYLKINGHFISSLANERLHQVKLKQIAEFARDMDKQTIAEYVQDAESLSLLWQEGVNYIQGYYLQQPQAELHYDFGTND